MFSDCDKAYKSVADFMATYAIGDLQGCFKQLQHLLELIAFSSSRDRLWFVGDLVNRGPDSLSLLRFISQLGDSAATVLGNHDLHLLLVAEEIASQRRGDTLQAILDAPDRDQLIYWLRHQKILHIEDDYVLVHAGLLPSWPTPFALELAQEVEAALQSSGYADLLLHLYGNQPDQWRDDLKSYDRLRLIVNALTRLRVCTKEGRMDFSYKGPLETIPSGYFPWFDVPGRQSQKSTIIFGHWSAIRLQLRHNLIALDTGCLWGGQLTAIRLEDQKIFQAPCAQPVKQAGVKLRVR